LSHAAGIAGGGALLSTATGEAAADPEYGSAVGKYGTEQRPAESVVAQNVTTEQLGADTLQVNDPAILAFGGGSEFDTYPITDYAGFHEAANAALSDGATYQIWPEGSWSTGTTLDVDLDSGLTATGAGHVATTGSETRITYTGTGRAVDGAGGAVNLSNVRYFGPGSGTSTTGIFSDTRTFLENVNINQFGTGVDIPDGSYYNSLQSVWCNNNGTGLTTDSNTISLFACRFNGNDVGLVADSFASFTMVGCSVEGNDTRGVDLQGSYLSPHIVGNYFENNGSQSVRAVGLSADKGQGGSVSYNYFNTGTGETGIRVANVTGLSVERNTILGNGDLGVFITPDAEDTRFSGEDLITEVTNAINDSGVRTLRNGVGTNGSNDPSSAGEWNGEGREGVTVKWDDGAGTDYFSIYRNGQWWDWTVA
jgi:hypothetical protein